VVVLSDALYRRVPLRQARADMALIAKRLEEKYPDLDRT
jgi:hypothetical protein